MESETVVVGNVKEKQGQYGPSLQIGVKDGNEWRNFFINDAALFSYFEKGATLTIEYEKKGNWNVVKGVSTGQGRGNSLAAPGKATPYKANDGDRNKSIEKQVISKVAGELFETLPTADEFGAWVNAAWTAIFGPHDIIEEAKEAGWLSEEKDDTPF